MSINTASKQIPHMPLKNNGKLPNRAGTLYANTGSCENLASLKSLGNITRKGKTMSGGARLTCSKGEVPRLVITLWIKL